MLLRILFPEGGPANKRLKNDGVQLGSDHERGEQHRRSQRAHHALLLQTGGSPAAARAPAGVQVLRQTDPPPPETRL